MNSNEFFLSQNDKNTLTAWECSQVWNIKNLRFRREFHLIDISVKTIMQIYPCLKSYLVKQPEICFLHGSIKKKSEFPTKSN